MQIVRGRHVVLWRQGSFNAVATTTKPGRGWKVARSHSGRHVQVSAERSAAVINGSLAVTLADDTLSATASASINATATVQLADDVLSASGSVSVNGVVALTLENDTLSADGEVAAAVGSGAVSVVEEDSTLLATATLPISGTASVQLGDDTLSATGSTLITGSAAITEADCTIAAAGVVSTGGGTGASAADVWNYALPGGLTTGALLELMATMNKEVWQEQGLDPDNPLTVTAGSRVFGSIVQTIAEAGGTVTVTRQ